MIAATNLLNKNAAARATPRVGPFAPRVEREVLAQFGGRREQPSRSAVSRALHRGAFSQSHLVALEQRALFEHRKKALHVLWCEGLSAADGARQRLRRHGPSSDLPG